MKKFAITVLTRGYPNINQYNSLIKRTNLIVDNIMKNSKYDFDMIIFHEGNIPIEHQKHISNLSETDLIFKNVKDYKENPAFNDSKNKFNYELCPPTPQSQCFPLGYKHMCHFWSIDFFNYLDDYDYVIRIDEDCFVTEFDDSVLDRITDGDVRFSSPLFQGQDEGYVIVGLEKLWNKFIKDNNLQPFKNFKEIKCPYTNFMILDLNFFKSNKIIQSFLKYVDESHGIYSNRWGDLPIWGVILSTLTNNSTYEESVNIKYYHLSHNKQIN